MGENSNKDTTADEITELMARAEELIQDGKIFKATELFKKAATLAEGIGDANMQISIYARLVNVLAVHGLGALAARMVKEIEEKMQEKSPIMHARLYIVLANSMAKVNMPELAARYYERAAEWLLESGDKNTRAAGVLSFYSAASYYEKADDYEKADEILLRATSIVMEISQEELESMVMNALSAFEEGDYEKATERINSLIKIYNDSVEKLAEAIRGTELQLSLLSAKAHLLSIVAELAFAMYFAAAGNEKLEAKAIEVIMMCIPQTVLINNTLISKDARVKDLIIHDLTMIGLLSFLEPKNDALGAIFKTLCSQILAENVIEDHPLFRIVEELYVNSNFTEKELELLPKIKWLKIRVIVPHLVQRIREVIQKRRPRFFRINGEKK